MNKANFIAAVAGVTLASATLVMATVGASGPRSSLFSPEEYEAAGQAIEGDTRLALLACRKLEPSAKAVCTAEAKAQDRIRRADLDARYLGTFDAAYSAQVARVEAEFDVEMKRCLATGGDVPACQGQATEHRNTTLAALRTPS